MTSSDSRRPKKRRIVFFRFLLMKTCRTTQKFELLLKELPNRRRNYVTTESLEPPRVGRSPAYKTNLQKNKRENRSYSHKPQNVNTYYNGTTYTTLLTTFSQFLCLVMFYCIQQSVKKTKCRKKRQGG